MAIQYQRYGDGSPASNGAQAEPNSYRGVRVEIPSDPLGIAGHRLLFEIPESSFRDLAKGRQGPQAVIRRLRATARLQKAPATRKRSDDVNRAPQTGRAAIAAKRDWPAGGPGRRRRGFWRVFGA